jgi:hypothetical protein
MPCVHAHSRVKNALYVHAHRFAQLYAINGVESSENSGFSEDLFLTENSTA